MISPLLMGACCCCGEPLFRHRRPDNSQMSCEALRCLDLEFRQSGTRASGQPDRHLQIIRGGRARGGDANWVIS